MFKWIYSEEINTEASAEQIWAIWKMWHYGLAGIVNLSG